MKKLLCLLLCLVMIVATFAACGKKDKDEAPAESTTAAPAGPSDPTPPAIQEVKKNYGIFMEGPIEYVLDDKGRLIEIWMLDEECLQREGSYSDELKPWIDFVYGTDGKLTKCSDMPISYDGQGNATMGDATAITLEYHTNGSIKLVEANGIGYGFDEQGRFASFSMPESANETMVYTYAYEANKVTVTFAVNDVPMEGVSVVMEFNADGNPIKALEIMGEETDECGWTWNGNKVASYYEYGTVTVSVEGGEGTPVQYKDETFFTYDANGNLTKEESKRDGVLKEYTVYTYNAAGKILSEKEYDAENVEQYSVIYEYDNNGNLLTKTRTKINGTVEVTDGEGRTIREVEKDEINMGPGITGYVLRETIYDYTVNEHYNEVRKVKNTYYDNNNTVIPAMSDEYWKINYIKIDEIDYGYKSYRVDEATGEKLSIEGYGNDQYGNYLTVDPNTGSTTSVHYYQKYCGDDGRIFYYTAEGVITYVA
ncbi:MAG: hypothetical protein IKA44_01270 [Clostridia bacterium]|nr:hypothetical protein [Clostridia bacterium]